MKTAMTSAQGNWFLLTNHPEKLYLAKSSAKGGTSGTPRKSPWPTWMAHLGLLAWVTGVLVGQLLMIGAVASTQIRHRRAGLPPDYTPLGPSLAGGAVLAVAVAGFQY